MGGTVFGSDPPRPPGAPGAVGRPSLAYPQARQSVTGEQRLPCRRALRGYQARYDFGQHLDVTDVSLPGDLDVTEYLQAKPVILHPSFGGESSLTGPHRLSGPARAAALVDRPVSLTLNNASNRKGFVRPQATASAVRWHV